MEKYFDFSAQQLQSITGLLPAISAAEMLYKDFPNISNALLEYSSQIIENQLLISENDQEIAAMFNKLKEMLKNANIASIYELERFADNLLSTNSPELRRLASLCYAATTIHKPLTKEISQKLILSEQQTQTLQQPISPTNTHLVQYPQTPLQNSGHPSRTNSSSTIQEPENLPLILAEIAKEAFLNKDNDVALTALTAAIIELQKGK